MSQHQSNTGDSSGMREGKKINSETFFSRNSRKNQNRPNILVLQSSSRKLALVSCVCVCACARTFL